MAETVPKGSLLKPNLGNAELYIFKSSLSSNIVLSWLIPVNYMFLYTKRGEKNARQVCLSACHISCTGTFEYLAKL